MNGLELIQYKCIVFANECFYFVFEFFLYIIIFLMGILLTFFDVIKLGFIYDLHRVVLLFLPFLLNSEGREKFFLREF